MNTLDLIKTLAAQGVGLADTEAMVGRAMTPDEVAVFRKTATSRRLRRAQEAQEAARKKRLEAEARAKAALESQLEGTDRNWDAHLKRPATALERQHKFRAAARELGEIPPVVDPLRRWLGEISLLDFGLTYFMTEFNPDGSVKVQRMLKRPPSKRMIRFITNLEIAIRKGGNRHVRWPRGKGKSTWIKIAAVWALVYGYRSFVVVIAATKPMAEEATAEIWRFMSEDALFAEDFPEFAVPLRDVALTPQRMRVQTYHGERTHICENTRFAYKRFARLAGYPSTGCIIAARGADQAIRGLNIGSTRPDFIFIDDPQSDDDAKSTGRGGRVEKIEDRIQGCLIALGETNRIIAAVMASTPIEPDDVSERFADPERHPEWITSTELFVSAWGPEELMREYLAAYRDDSLRNDPDFNSSRYFYSMNRAAIEEGVEMMDEQDFDASAGEVSAYQHALNMLFTMKRKRFDSEMQMKPTRSQGLFKISAGLVAERVTGYDLGVVPPECDQGALAFCDVNAVAGLRWGIMAFGKGRVTTLVAYGSYPPRGVRLFPEGTPEPAIPRYLAPAIRAVAGAIKSTALVTPDGVPVKVRGICFDGGWQTETVATVCQELDGKDGYSVCWSKGYDAKSYSYYHHEKAKSVQGLRSGEMCHTWATANGQYLAFNSDYWREMAQSSFLADPLTESSCSFFGADKTRHYDFASEVCGEELVAKDEHPKYGTVWQWKKLGPNHYGDVVYGCMVYGAIRGNYDPIVKLATTEELKFVSRQRKVRYVYKG